MNNIKRFFKRIFSLKNHNYSLNYLFEEKKFENFSRIQLSKDIDASNNEIFFGFIMSFEMTILSYYLTERMVEEKEKKLSDFLERQGISKRKYNLSWFVTYIILSILPFISYFFLLAILSIPAMLLCNFIMLVLYFSGVYSFMYFFYTTISTLKNGSIIIKSYNFVSTVIGIGLSMKKVKRGVKLPFAFFPNINIYYCTSVAYFIPKKRFFHYIVRQIKNIAFIESIIFFVGEIIIINLISFIIQSYKKSGLSFCRFLISCCVKVRRNIDNHNNLIEESENIVNYEIHHQELTMIEKHKKNSNKLLQITGISKNFGSLKALNNINLELFSNEIFCLLGHNGAGKTTLVNIISGLIEPEQGDVFLDGESLITNKNLIYQNIGLCQQEDILFDFLTVEEHLQYIYDIKGIERNFNEIQELIVNLDLADVQTRLCKDLSGGQKRKTCIALALMGGGKITILDEPTSGMDIIAKKKLWDFLKNYQKNKILLVTTHSLEEAEFLGTRIGIMCDGRLICTGTSTFLKNNYPCGININLVINSRIFNENSKKEIFEKIKGYEPLAEIKIASKGVFSINIQQNNAHILEIFNFIEETKAQYGIEDYIVGSASLEDVFLKINNKSNIKDMKYFTQDNGNDEEILIRENNLYQPVGFCKQLCSQIYRNLLPIKRNIFLFILEYFGGLICSYIFTLIFRDIFFKSDRRYHYYYLAKYKYLSLYNKTYLPLKSIKENYIKAGNIKINNKYYFDSNILYNLPENNINLTNNLELKSFSKKYNSENVLSYFGISIIFAFVIYLGGVVYEKIKERKNKTKYLLYLSGCNMWSYWGAFFIIDFIKLLIFSVLVFLPIFFISDFGIYGILTMPLTCISSLFFIYFFSSFWKNEDSGTKILITMITLILLIITIIYAFILGPISEKSHFVKSVFFNFMRKKFMFTLFDLTPFTSLGITFLRLASSIDQLKFGHSRDKYHHPKIYVFSSFMAQSINMLIYFSLMLLNESGCFTKCNNKMCLSNSNFTFSEETVNADFYAYNNLRNPLLMLQNYEQNNENNNNMTNNDQSNNTNNQNNNINIQNNSVNSNNDRESIRDINNISSINDSRNPSINNINVINTSNNQNNINISNDNNQTNINNESNNNNNFNNNTTNNQQIQPPNYNYLMPEKNVELNKTNQFIEREIQKINNQSGLTTKIQGLYKTFFSCCHKNVRVVNNLYLGLEANEKFGLLGFNGSGKTTLFRAITNEIFYEKGSVSIFGYDAKTEFDKLRPMIGYCPQENPLFDFMKVREILKFYLNLKNSTETVESISSTFNLTQYLDTFCINLSGGNKRKLTFAIALMNKPSLLLLDEPSTGVDPESRRIMWKNINELSNTGHKYNMILTTHSIEEAEILCDRVSWLKQGNFVCIGNPEQLKLNYSNGYKLHIKFVDNVLNREDISKLTRKMVQDAYMEIIHLIQGFQSYSNYILSNPIVILYIRILIDIAKEIKPNTSNLSLIEIGKDFSFEIKVVTLKERQKFLFSQIFNLKTKNPKIAEISINLESLGNILTSFR